MGANKLTGLAGALLTLIGIFLPAVSMLGVNVSMWGAGTGDRFIYLGLAVAGGLLAFMGKTRALIGTGLVTIGFIGLAYKNAADAGVADVIGVGIYAIAIGGLLQLVAGFMKPAAANDPSISSAS